jgi:hypothetical protein
MAAIRFLVLRKPKDLWLIGLICSSIPGPRWRAVGESRLKHRQVRLQEFTKQLGRLKAAAPGRSPPLTQLSLSR